MPTTVMSVTTEDDGDDDGNDCDDGKGPAVRDRHPHLCAGIVGQSHQLAARGGSAGRWPIELL
jgi:hypothetical protein